jgi:hypothetical protein
MAAAARQRRAKRFADRISYYLIQQPLRKILLWETKPQGDLIVGKANLERVQFGVSAAAYG